MSRNLNRIDNSTTKSLSGVVTLTDGFATLENGVLSGISSFSANTGTFTNLDVSGNLTAPILTLLEQDDINTQSNVIGLQDRTQNITASPVQLL